MVAQEKAGDVLVLSSYMERVEIIRMGTGTDLLDGLNAAVKEKGIKNAVILAGIGSVTDYHFHVVSDKNLPPARGISQGIGSNGSDFRSGLHSEWQGPCPYYPLR